MGRMGFGGWGLRRLNPPPSGLRPPPPSTEWRGEKRRLYSDIAEEVTLPHLMGKGRGWGLLREPRRQRGNFEQPIGGSLILMGWADLNDRSFTNEASPDRLAPLTLSDRGEGKKKSYLQWRRTGKNPLRGVFEQPMERVNFPLAV